MSKKIFSLLFEEEQKADTPETSMTMTSSGLKARKAADSVDDQIDALILRYEASSIRDENKKVDGLLEKSLVGKNLKFLIEQEEDEFAAIPDEGPGLEDSPPEEEGDQEAPDPVGSEKMDVDEPAEEMTPDLDIDAFAARTVRLIINFKSLLRMEEAIANRIKNFLDTNYGDKFVKMYLDILENQYGIKLEEFKVDHPDGDEKFAVGANAAGTGGLGGGA